MTRRIAAMREQHPVVVTVGDVLSLIIGWRASNAKSLIQRVEIRLSGKAAVAASETLASDVGKLLKGPHMVGLARAGVRSVEAGVEAG